jgi:hypothetical protein
MNHNSGKMAFKTWKTQNPTNHISAIRNRHRPRPEGSGWGKGLAARFRVCTAPA